MCLLIILHRINLLHLALVEFLEPSEARKAFTKLAYTKYKHLPLYLEWAPDNSFITPPAVKNKTINETNEKTKVGEQEKELSENVNVNKVNKEESEDEDEPEPDTTLFVKNINFSTTDEQLKTVNNLSNIACYYLICNIFFFFFIVFRQMWSSSLCLDSNEERSKKSWCQVVNGLWICKI